MPQLQHTIPANATQVAKQDTTTKKDSIVGPVYVAPKYPGGFSDPTIADSTTANISKLPIIEPPKGLLPKNYTDTPIKSGGAMLMVLFSFLFIALSVSRGLKFFGVLWKNLFSLKDRENAFNDHTINETQMIFAFIINTCVMEGLLVYLAITQYFSLIPVSTPIIYPILICMAMCGVYYIVQLGMYLVLGYVFGDKNSTSQWVAGFKASQAYLGLLLTPISLLACVYPSNLEIWMICGFALYILMRILFISKGFRIFFNNVTSSLYFILYLCSVEIVPAILSWLGAVFICSLIH